ncbi:HTTM domain-containing protein [Streptomyces neyagawaensis]|uniref:HTTM domain-containing protein n=1 Tax=Streptomyces neyagawaensis TaxID=42238 RepID=A0ABV3AUF4_9ACTN
MSTTVAPARPSRFRERLARIAGFVRTTQAPYQAAVFRIALSTVIAAFLLREWPHRRVLWGDRSPLSFDMAHVIASERGTFSLLSWSDDRLWFEIVYALTIAAALAVMVGWRTRTMAVLLMVGLLSVENRNLLVDDGGDNIMRIMVVYLVFTRCGRVWSLDARRLRSQAAAKVRSDRTGVALWIATGLFLLVGFGLPTAVDWPLVFWLLWAAHGVWYAANRDFPGHEVTRVLDAATAMLHNCAIVVIAVQVCFIYSTAGWYKIRGSLWQEGSALYYALNVDYFAPWPELSELLASNAVIVLMLTYGTVIVQVAFPFTLFSRRVKNVLIAVMVAEHLGIALLMGITFLSLVMVACDAVFLPTAFLLAVGGRSERLRTHLPRLLQARSVSPG